MDKKELLAVCRFYDGEKENPFPEGNPYMFWGYERMWVEAKGGEISPPDAREYYDHLGLKDFSPGDGVPLSLRLLLFSRYLHWMGGYGEDSDREGFKKFYLEEYLGNKKEG